MKTQKKQNKRHNKTTKTHTQPEEERGGVFVFYTFTDKENPASWRYTKKFPKGWYWVGSGTTSPIGEKSTLYENEEQFAGPKNTQSQMIKYLTAFFKIVKQKNDITRYKIRTSYLP
jgi:hypothetical protein